ncbi:MAG: hypothetical protein LBK63_02115 [Treponema sp.]|jgi:hypothetical protein|nr:hypothetical protein [Treponema sp.]
MSNENKTLYEERLQRVVDAIALKETDRIPFVPFFDGILQSYFGSNYRDNYYDFRKAGDATVKFYETFPLCDAQVFQGFRSGKASEIAGTRLIDWPGRPGTKVPDSSTHQVIEYEFMTQDEYPELLKDYTGFMIRKYIPRAYANLQGLSGVNLTSVTGLMGTTFLSPLYAPVIQDAYKTLAEVAKLDGEAGALFMEYSGKLAAAGFPPFFTGIAEAPYDILGDYFRGTLGIMEDLMDHEDEISAACDMFADLQIEALQYFRFTPLPVKRVFFPLHKGMDGFMSPKQYEQLYWKPLKKVMMALIDMGVTPFIYTEGKYNTRLEYLTDVPKGKVIYHFEEADMKRAKSMLGGIACITGNLSITLMEFGKKEQVVDYCKFLIDTCAPGGGYIFDFNGSLHNAKKENLEALFEVFETYR